MTWGDCWDWLGQSSPAFRKTTTFSQYTIGSSYFGTNSKSKPECVTWILVQDFVYLLSITWCGELCGGYWWWAPAQTMSLLEVENWSGRVSKGPPPPLGQGSLWCQICFFLFIKVSFFNQISKQVKSAFIVQALVEAIFEALKNMVWKVFWSLEMCLALSTQDRIRYFTFMLTCES